MDEKNCASKSTTHWEHVLDLRAPIVPVGQSRPRFARVGAGVRTYKAAGQEKAEAQLGHFVLEAIGPEWAILEGPLRLVVDLTMPIPGSWSKKKKALAEAGLIGPATKPDLDNALKHLLDVCNGTVWRDDKQVVGIQAWKTYGVSPGWAVEVFEFKPGAL